jgi:hypothetical protein
VPVEWQALASRYPSAASSGWLLHGPASAHAVSLEQGEFLILAEREGDEFLMLQTSPSGGYWTLDGHDGIPRPLGVRVDAWLKGRLTTSCN